MVISATERQAFLLFDRILDHIYNKNKKLIKKGKDRPTKKRLILTNGSVIHCLPVGKSGYGVRGFTINELYADEAAFIEEDVWSAVTPMLATTGGSINLLSTPFGTENYFYRAFHDKKFTAIHVNTPDVAKEREEPQRTRILEFLKDEKERMTKLQYQQEYLGLFVGGIQRFFPDELIEQICTLPTSAKVVGLYHIFPDEQRRETFQGIDVARMGGDDTVLISLNRINKERLVQRDITIPEGQTITDTARLIIDRDKILNHRKIYIDTGGLGIGVYDILFEDNQTRNKVVSIDNARTEIDREKGQDENRKRTIDKIYLYNNLKNIMENHLIQLYDDPRIKQSLRSMQYENEDGVLKIYGNYAHIAEALKNAAWCMKDKSLNIWCGYTKHGV